MKLSVVVGTIASLTLSLGACSTPQFQTLKILDSPNRVVALRVMPDAYESKGYDHPVSITTDEMSRILKGVRVQRGLLSSTQHAAFSGTEIRLFAPHFVHGLQRATPEELVTFFETAEIETGRMGSDFQLTTSGGLYVAGGNFHVVLSNFSVKTPLWQDVEEYETSVRNRPLEQLEAQPGRLVFVPREFMVASPDGEMGSLLKGKPWQVAIRLNDFLETQNHVSGNNLSIDSTVKTPAKR